MSQLNYGQKSRWPLAAAVSLVLIILLLVLLKSLSSHAENLNKDQLVVYCAAGLRMPILELTKNYSSEFGIPVKLEYGSSGELESKLLQDASYKKERAHLYIPADESFSRRTEEVGLTVNSLPMAAFHLVLAVKPDDEVEIRSVEDLLSKEIPFAICHEKAGAGKRTKFFLEKSSFWEKVSEQRKVVSTKVTDCANLIKTSNNVRAGFIWNTTAKQFGLRIIELPELQESLTFINVSLTKTSKTDQALHLARYLSSSERSSVTFSKYGFRVPFEVNGSSSE